MGLKHILKIFILILISLFLLIFIIRLFSPRHLDDLHPNIPCEEKLIKKSDYLAIIPKYNNLSISENKEWCDYIAGFNKSLIMHGVYHTFKEFNIEKDFNYISEGKNVFTNCFNFSPLEFKPPQLALSKENKKILEEKFNFKVHSKFAQIFHKTYHCDNSGLFPNWIIDWI